MANKQYKLTLSLSNGNKIDAGTILVPQGDRGETGGKGATFTPSVSEAGVLSWTNNGGLTNPTPVNIKGPKGDDAVITASDVAGWGFTKNAGTITGIKMNGVSKGTSGVVDLGTVLTSHQDISGLMPKSGGTFTGIVTFNKQINLGQGDANCLYLGTDGRLNGPENRTLFGLVSGATTFGHTAYALKFRGSGTRPTFNGNDLALKSDVPETFDDLTRIKKQGYAGANNAVQYFKLATFPVYNSSGNYASLIITGRMGGWEAGNMSFVNMILYNRGAEGGGYVSVDNGSFSSLCDIVMYRETDGSSTVYLKVSGYYTFDININTFQSVYAYTGSNATPTGTLQWTASSQADRLVVSDAVAYVNGHTLPKTIQINGNAVNPNASGLVNLGDGFAKTSDIPTLQWVTPTSQDEITSAIMWKVSGQSIVNTYDSVQTRYILYGIGSGSAGTVAAVGDNSRRGAVQLYFGAGSYWGITGIVQEGNSSIVRHVPMQSVEGVTLSKWKILKYA